MHRSVFATSLWSANNIFTTPAGISDVSITWISFAMTGLISKGIRSMVSTAMVVAMMRTKPSKAWFSGAMRNRPDRFVQRQKAAHRHITHVTIKFARPCRTFKDGFYVACTSSAPDMSRGWKVSISAANSSVRAERFSQSNKVFAIVNGQLKMTSQWPYSPPQRHFKIFLFIGYRMLRLTDPLFVLYIHHLAVIVFQQHNFYRFD